MSMSRQRRLVHKCLEEISLFFYSMCIGRKRFVYIVVYILSKTVV